MSERTITPSAARTATWNVYMSRVNRILQQQWQAFAAGERVQPITMIAPSDDELHIVERALENAEREGQQAAIGKALRPVITAIDGIDNSGLKKRKEARELYSLLSGVCDELQKVKAAAASQEDS